MAKALGSAIYTKRKNTKSDIEPGLREPKKQGKEAWVQIDPGEVDVSDLGGSSLNFKVV